MTGNIPVISRSSTLGTSDLKPYNGSNYMLKDQINGR